MNPDSLGELRGFFDAAAPRWANRSFDRILMEELLDLVPLAPGARVLDLGGGTGHLLASLRRRVTAAGVVCLVDLSLGMLRQAAESAAAANAWRCCGRAENLPLQRGAWDVVIGMGLYPHLADRPASLAEIRGLLVPSGQVAFLHLIGRDRLNDLHRGIGGVVATHLLPPAEEVAQVLANAGFTVEREIDGEDRFLVAGRLPATNAIRPT